MRRQVHRGRDGGGDERLPHNVRHMLRDVGLRLAAGRRREPRPDLVLVAVERGHVALRLAAARDRARGAPVVAVLRSSDAGLAGRALAAGAHTCHALDTSVEYLRDAALVLLGLSAVRERRATSRRAGRGPAAEGRQPEVRASSAPASPALEARA